MSKCILLGFTGAGKTTVGRALATQWDLSFCDLDGVTKAHLDEKFGEEKTLNAHVKQIGMDRFREYESACLMSLSDGDKSVIATGGGLVLSYENRLHLQRLGKCVYLHISLPLAWERYDKGRGLYADYDVMAHAYAERRGLYESLALQTINVDKKTVAEIIQEIEYGK